MTEPVPGFHVLQLRDHRTIPLASVAAPSDTEIVSFVIHYTRGSAHALLSALGADADGFLAAIEPSEFLTKRELEPGRENVGR